MNLNTNPLYELNLWIFFKGEKEGDLSIERERERERERDVSNVSNVSI